jgi:hypothetical protein
VTEPSSLQSERGGEIRSSRAPTPISVLVMSADPGRRGAWAKFFEDQGMRTIRCAGPKATTCALELSQKCPLHESADLIFYDEESVTPELEAQLDLAVLSTPVAYASSMRSPQGGEYPVTERVRPTARRVSPPR